MYWLQLPLICQMYWLTWIRTLAREGRFSLLTILLKIEAIKWQKLRQSISTTSTTLRAMDRSISCQATSFIRPNCQSTALMLHLRFMDTPKALQRRLHPKICRYTSKKSFIAGNNQGQKQRTCRSKSLSEWARSMNCWRTLDSVTSFSTLTLFQCH